METEYWSSLIPIECRIQIEFENGDEENQVVDKFTIIVKLSELSIIAIV